MLRRLGDAVVPVEEPSDVAARRRRIVGRMEGLLRANVDERDARAKRSRIVGVLLLAAAVLLAVGFGWRATRGAQVAGVAPELSARVAAATGAVVRTHAGHADVIAVEAPLDLGDELATAGDGEARVALPSGANVELSSATQLRLATIVGSTKGHAESFDLAIGRLTVQVPKLGAGESFRVRTPDAEIVVHGTAFVLSVREDRAGTPSRTHLRVTEGTVSVRAEGTETFVHAGEEWPSTPALPPPFAPTPTPTPTRAATTSPHKPAAPVASSDPSTLAAQNQLFQSALDARQGGDDSRALTLLNQLLARYPTSPLAQEAQVQRFRTLDRMGDLRGASVEARHYLAAYPDGFAREEAKAIALRASP
jgi:hypothetical protein